MFNFFQQKIDALASSSKMSPIPATYMTAFAAIEAVIYTTSIIGCSWFFTYIEGVGTCNIGVLGSTCVNLGEKHGTNEILYKYLLPLMALIALCFPKIIGSFAGFPLISQIIFTGLSAIASSTIAIMLFIYDVRANENKLVHYSNCGPIVYVIMILGLINGAVSMSSMIYRLIDMYIVRPSPPIEAVAGIDV